MTRSLGLILGEVVDVSRIGGGTADLGLDLVRGRVVLHDRGAVVVEFRVERRIVGWDLVEEIGGVVQGGGVRVDPEALGEDVDDLRLLLDETG